MTSTDRRERARIFAALRPADPPPTTTTSTLLRSASAPTEADLFMTVLSVIARAR